MTTTTTGPPQTTTTTGPPEGPPPEGLVELAKDDLDYYYKLDGGDGEGISWRNTTGSPIVSITPNKDGQLVAGFYRIRFQTGSVTPGVAATVIVDCPQENNPNIGTYTADLTGGVNDHLIKGLDRLWGEHEGA